MTNRLFTPSISPAVQAIAPQPLIQSIVQPVAQPLVQSIVQPVIQPITPPVEPQLVQSVIQPVSPPLTQSIVQPVTQPLVQSVVAPPVTPVVQPVVQTIVQPIPQPVVQVIPQPVVTLPQPTVPQLVPQPVTPGPRPLAPSPSYEKYIPPTPMTQAVANEIGPKVYQFYQYVPAQQNAIASIQQGPAFSTITTPIQNTNLSVGVPQFSTLTYI